MCKLQTFAEEYKDAITFIYYCANVILAILAFLVGSLYISCQTRRDQDKRARENLRYQESRDDAKKQYQLWWDQEYQRREWRQFAVTIHREYSQLKSEATPQKILEVKETFEHLFIHSKVTGLDVLRYMIADDDYLVSVTPQLSSLRGDLHKIFLPLSICSSLILLGEVPVNIKDELKHVVKVLGNIAKPFSKGVQRTVVLRCLETFCNSIKDAETERLMEELDEELKEIVPYVNNLQFYNFMGRGSSHAHGESDLPAHNSAKNGKFTFNPVESGMINDRDNFEVLKKLHGVLENREHMKIYVKKFKEPPLKLLDGINDGDSDEVVFTKVLHEVRYYIHYLQKNRSLTEIDGGKDAVSNMNRLRKVHEEMCKFPPVEDRIALRLHSCGDELKSYADKPPVHICNDKFLESFSNLWDYKVKHMFQVGECSRSESDGKENEGSTMQSLSLPQESSL